MNDYASARTKNLSKVLNRIGALCFVVVLLAISATAQITIRIPGIKKPQPTKPPPTQPTSPQPTNSPNTTVPGPIGNKTPTSVGNGSGGSSNRETGATREEVHSFQGDMKPYAKGIYMIRGMAKAANSARPERSGCSTAANVRKAMDDGAAFHEIVKQKYPTIENPSWANDGTGNLDVGDLRRYVENRVEHAKSCINAAFASVLPNHVQGIEQATANLKSGKSEGFAFGRDFDDPTAKKAELSEKYKEIYAVVGMTMPDDSVFAPYDAALKALVEEGRKHVGEWTYPWTYHNAFIEAKARGFFARWEPRGTIVKINTKYSDWQVSNHSNGLISGRYNGGYIMFRRPGVQPCFVVAFSFEQNYMGGGKYNDMAVGSGMTHALRLQNCK